MSLYTHVIESGGDIPPPPPDNTTSNTTIIQVQDAFVLDRFIGGNVSAIGNNTNANIGELQWNTARATADGTVARVASEAEHMGIVRLTGAVATGMHQAIYLGHAAASGSLVALEELDYLEFVVRNIGVGRFRFGIGDDAAAAGLGSNAIVVLANNDVEDEWHVQTRDGGVITDVATDIPIVDDEWITWKIQIVAEDEIQFYADGELVHTAVADVPALSTLMAPAVQVVTFTPGPFQGIGEIDTFRMLLKIPVL